MSGRVLDVIFKRLGKLNFTNPERSQFGRDLVLPIRKGPNFASPERSYFCQSGRVLLSSIRKGPIFANPEGSQFCQSGRVLFFVNPERSQKYHLLINIYNQRDGRDPKTYVDESEVHSEEY